MSIWGSVSTCIAYHTDTFWKNVCHLRPHRVWESWQVVAKIKSRCFLNFPRQTRENLQRAQWNISKPCKHTFTSIWGIVSTCIALYTETFWQNGICTSCWSNKITMLLKFLKTDSKKFMKGPSEISLQQREMMLFIGKPCKHLGAYGAVLAPVSPCVLTLFWQNVRKLVFVTLG